MSGTYSAGPSTKHIGITVVCERNIPERISPERYFAQLKAASEAVRIKNAVQTTLVDRSGIRQGELKQSNYFLRNDGKKLFVTRDLVACFFDVTVVQMSEILCISSNETRRLRRWSGYSRWPKQELVANKHRTLTLKLVCEHRMKLMLGAQGKDDILYQMLVSAHKLAGYVVDPCPQAQLAGAKVLLPRIRPREEYLVDRMDKRHCSAPRCEDVPLQAYSSAETSQPTEAHDASLPESSMKLTQDCEENWLTEDLLDIPEFHESDIDADDQLWREFLDN